MHVQIAKIKIFKKFGLKINRKIIVLEQSKCTPVLLVYFKIKMSSPFMPRAKVMVERVRPPPDSNTQSNSVKTNYEYDNI